jgi:hypothetical protein
VDGRSTGLYSEKLSGWGWGCYLPPSGPCWFLFACDTAVMMFLLSSTLVYLGRMLFVWQGEVIWSGLVVQCIS